MPVEISAGAVGTHRRSINVEHHGGSIHPDAVVIKLIRTVRHSNRSIVRMKSGADQPADDGGSCQLSKAVPVPASVMVMAIPLAVMPVPSTTCVTGVVMKINVHAVVM